MGGYTDRVHSEELTAEKLLYLKLELMFTVAYILTNYITLTFQHLSQNHGVQ